MSFRWQLILIPEEWFATYTELLYLPKEGDFIFHRSQYVLLKTGRRRPVIFIAGEFWEEVTLPLFR